MTRTFQTTAFLVALSALPVFAATSEPMVPTEPTSLTETATAAAALTAVEPFRVAVVAPAPNRGSMLPALYVGMAGIQAYDVASTLQALGRGATEANPLMKGAVKNPAVLIGVKASLAASTIYASERLWKRNHKTAAVVLMVASNVFYSAVAYNNANVLRTLR